MDFHNLVRMISGLWKMCKNKTSRKTERMWIYMCIYDIIPSLTVEKQKNGCKASKIKAYSRFLFRSDMCYCAIFFTLW